MSHGDRPDHGYSWVTACEIGEFVRRVQALREGEQPGIDTDPGEPPRPATAIRALHAFAVMRPTADLIEAARKDFSYRDAVSVLATAALCRSVPEAAELTIRQWRAESKHGDRTPKTDDIIRDIARQRTVPDVAAFVRECRKADKAPLVAKTLGAFTEPRSGRRSLDKALLYIALRDEGCAEEAVELLGRTLKGLGDLDATNAVDDADALDDLVGALHELSPSERILEEWIDKELRFPQRVPYTIGRVVRLTVGRPPGRDALVEHIGRHWRRHDLVELCSQLCRTAPDKCAQVRLHAASRHDVQELADVIIAWRGAESLARTTRDLLRDIVAMRAAPQGGPRSLSDLADLDHVLRNIRADPECNRMLRLVAAEHVDGRSGADLATLLHRIERRGDRWRAAQNIAAQLTARALRQDDAASRTLVDYIKALREAQDTRTIATTLKELADSSRSGHSSHSGHAHAVWVTLVADIAERLCRLELTDDAMNLLERCLESEHRIAPEDAPKVVGRLRGGGAKPPEWVASLLSATVGRWFDAHLRDSALQRLSEAGFVTEAEGAG
ncbi:hypothetical protein GCM10010218_61090 [Streptomyces mashuensis]|uniref:Uncharacterized protein n=1 Tax=Streptomyces mashuensis TaxID=33904 RepID=A0A919EFA8_9ACTN|nr:hypothetical protein [Streptomyces mashuensis]GHF71653.1 hypothetical protein GCM10010218_61090 [Streptomyces mashuensis]